MKTQLLSIAAVLLALIAAFAIISDATKHTSKVKKGGIKFRIRWWDDEREKPYRIVFKIGDVKSKFTFDTRGYLIIIRVDDVRSTFAWSDIPNGGIELLSVAGPTAVSESGATMLPNNFGDVMDERITPGQRRLYKCDDCENTYGTLCLEGMLSVCYLYDRFNTYDWGFTADTVNAIAKLCKKFSKVCDQTDGATLCDGYCEDSDDAGGYQGGTNVQSTLNGITA